MISFLIIFRIIFIFSSLYLFAGPSSSSSLSQPLRITGSPNVSRETLWGKGRGKEAEDAIIGEMIGLMRSKPHSPPPGLSWGTTCTKWSSISQKQDQRTMKETNLLMSQRHSNKRQPRRPLAFPGTWLPTIYLSGESHQWEMGWVLAGPKAGPAWLGSLVPNWWRLTLKEFIVQGDRKIREATTQEGKVLSHWGGRQWWSGRFHGVDGYWEALKGWAELWQSWQEQAVYQSNWPERGALMVLSKDISWWELTSGTEAVLCWKGIKWKLKLGFNWKLNQKRWEVKMPSGNMATEGLNQVMPVRMMKNERRCGEMISSTKLLTSSE